MDQQLYLKYLKEYTLEALDKAEDNVSQAADYLEKKTKTKIFYERQRGKKSRPEPGEKSFFFIPGAFFVRRPKKLGIR